MGKDLKVCHFQESWRQDERFKEWVRKHPSDNKKAICLFCNKREIKLHNMGVSALTSHMKSKGHNEVENTNVRMRLFFNPQPSAEEQRSSTSTVIDDDGAQSSTSASAHMVPAASAHATAASPASAEIALNAEIRWALKCVMSHFSYRSNVDNGLLFQAMAPGYEPFKHFKMSKDKVRYLIVYGLAPFFKSILLDTLNRSPFLTLMFDESLNYNVQANQMDIQIRYWDPIDGKAVTQYVDSKFIQRGNADNLSSALKKFVAEEIEAKKMIALSMDGPTVNWNVLTQINKHRNDFSELHDLADIGKKLTFNRVPRGPIESLPSVRPSVTFFLGNDSGDFSEIWHEV